MMYGIMASTFACWLSIQQGELLFSAHYVDPYSDDNYFPEEDGDDEEKDDSSSVGASSAAS